MCEGSNEEKIIDLLLDYNKLKISRDDLIGRRPYHIRNLKGSVIKNELKHYNQVVTVCRIGDKQGETLAVPSELKHIVLEENVFKYCTKPELEILLIINENLISEFEKSKKEPKEFAKDNIKYNGRRYNQSSLFLEKYYEGSNIENLVKNLIEYKRIKKHEKDELYLADLLNSQSIKAGKGKQNSNNKKRKPVR